ncbi:MAG: hypothetical protein ACRDVC_10865 [Acidimicrobiales bacterium]
MAQDYDDGIIKCDAEGLEIRRYYFPVGSKRVKYAEIKGLQRLSMGTLNGQWRIWGTANFNYWANLDPKRPKKQVAFIVDDGKRVKPFITPDDPDALETVLRERAGLGPSTGDSSPAPFI